MSKIKLTWKGESATLTEDQAFLAADAVEQVATFGELVEMRMKPGKIRFVLLAKAYAALLTEAGIPTKAREVHREFMKVVNAGGNAEKRLALAVEAIDWLLMVLMDGAPEPEASEGDTGGNLETSAS